MRKLILITLSVFFLFSCGQKEELLNDVSGKMKAEGMNGKYTRLDGFAVKTALKSMGIEDALVYQDNSTVALVMVMKSENSIDKLRKDLPKLASMAMKLNGGSGDIPEIKPETLEKAMFVSGRIALISTGVNTKKLQRIILSK